MSSEAERSFSASWWLVDELVRGGLTDACVSPGSRSTPIALALWRHPHVRVHVHLDERASSFFALGLAKATARPVAVACTSGTAVAELMAGVVEASMSRAPLVLLTADRPPELRGVGANQTIRQPGIFGTFVSASIDADVPGDRSDETYWRALGAQAIRATLGPPPGPIHLNLPFREPLVPGPVELPASAPPSSTPELVEAPEPEEVEALGREIASTAHGLILAGSLRETSPAVVELARRAAWPLVAEPTSGSRVPGALAAGQLLLADGRFSKTHVPDVVLQLGAAPTSRAGLSLVARCRRLVIVDPDRLVADPNRRAGRTVTADLAGLVEEVLEDLDPRPETPWLRDWLEADARARTAVDQTLDTWDEPTEGRVARDVAGALPDRTVLVVGSSMPIRDLDTSMAPRDGLSVIANRGASGIDGFISTALGVAAAGAPTVALCGDLTFLHDIGSLLWRARKGPKATFVVLDNGGGTIFSFLAQRELPELDELFTTPHGLDLAAVCASAGAGYERVERSIDLVPALERAMRTGSVDVVHVVVDPERNRACHADVTSAVADVLG